MGRISRFLQEYIAEAEKDRLAPAEIDKRTAAIGELFREGRSQSQLAEVMTTAMFTNYLVDGLNRIFYADYAYEPAAWPAYTHPDTVQNFQRVSRLRLGTPGTLYKRRDKAELKAAAFGVTKIDLGVEEFGRQYDFSWHLFQNDDLGALRDTPKRMAIAARRFEDQFVSNLYDNTTSQAALVALGALYAGTGRLTIANLAIGINAFTTRVDSSGNLINPSKIHLVIPPALRITTAQMLQDILTNGGPNSNVLAQFIAGVHVDPYITTSGADVPWYLFVDPREIPGVTVARLEGTTQPWTYMKRSDIEMVSGSAPAAFQMGSFATGDIEYGVEDVLGGWDSATYGGITDYQGIYYSSGTTA